MIVEADFFSAGHLRWSLGWPSPNYAGAFIATLLALMFTTSGTRWRWAFLIGETGLMFLLAKTYSRGAVVAWGLAWLFGIAARRGWRRSGERWLWLTRAVACALILFVVDFSWKRTGEVANLTETIHNDGSVVNRLNLWEGGLRMIATAPLSGWGAGESGRAYMNWYQELSRDEGYSTMVNSYLHVAVEHGLPVLAFVLFVVGALIGMAWCGTSQGNGRAQGVPLPWLAGFNPALGAGATFVAWVVANIFTTLWIEPRLWVVPCIACLLLGWSVGKAGWRNSLKPASVMGTCLAVLGTACLYGAGKWQAKGHALQAIPSGHGAVTIGPGDHDLPEWHAWPDTTVLGSTPGKEFRRWLETEEAPRLRLTVHRAMPTTTSRAIVSTAKDVMLFGRQASRIERDLPSAWEELWVIHPTVAPPAVEATLGPGLSTSITVVLPQIDEIGNGAAWRRWAERHKARVVISPDCGVDIRTNWPDVLKTKANAALAVAGS